MTSALTAWRDQINAHEQETATLHGDEGGHGHGHGHPAQRDFPLRRDDPDRTDDSVLNSLYESVRPQTTVLDVASGVAVSPVRSRRKRCARAYRARWQDSVTWGATAVRLVKPAPQWSS